MVKVFNVYFVSLQPHTYYPVPDNWFILCSIPKKYIIFNPSSRMIGLWALVMVCKAKLFLLCV